MRRFCELSLLGCFYSNPPRTGRPSYVTRTPCRSRALCIAPSQSQETECRKGIVFLGKHHRPLLNRPTWFAANFALAFIPACIYFNYKLLSLQCNLLGLSDPLSIPVARPTAGLIMIIKEAPFTYFVKLMRPGGRGLRRVG